MSDAFQMQEIDVTGLSCNETFKTVGSGSDLYQQIHLLAEGFSRNRSVFVQKSLCPPPSPNGMKPFCQSPILCTFLVDRDPR